MQKIKKLKKLKKQKKPTRGKLVKKLDAIFSRYIRLKNADSNGMVQCYTCLEQHHRKKIQNGHFVSRWNYKYRWSEDNCRPQCYKCNCIYSGNYKLYTLKMIREYGEEKINKILKDKELIKISTAEIIDMIERYTILVDKLLEVLSK